MKPLQLIFCLALCCACALCRAELSEPSAPPDTTAKKRFVLATVRVIAESPPETIGAVHLVNYPETGGSSSLNLYEGLQGISGISNTVGTKDESNLRIRGFRKNEVKLLIDGRPLNSGYFGNVDLQQLAPGDIREIHILKGPGSAVYGSGTMGGVVNIITSDPDNSSWLKLDILSKRNNSNRFALTSSHRINDFGYWIYAAREHNEGIVLPADFPSAPFENGGVRNHSLKTQYDLQTRLDYQLSPFQQVGASAGISLVPERFIPSSIYSLEYRAYKDWMRHWATTEHEGILNEYLKLSTLLYYDGGRDTYLQYNDADHEHLSLESQMRYHTLGFNPRLEWVPDERNTVNSGFRVESLVSTRKDNGSYPVWTPHWLNLYNAFSQWQFQLSGLTSLTAGLGLSSHQSDLKRSLSLYPEPSAGIYLRWTEQSRTSLSLGRNTSFPTMRQLFSADRGNPDLLPQHALKLELDHQQGTPLGSWMLRHEFSIFYNDMRDLIDVLDGTYQNIFRVRSWGAEYSLLLSPASWWETSLQYSYLTYRSGSDYRLTESPRNQAGLSQSLRLPWQFSLSYDCQYTDLRWSQDSSSIYHALPSYWKHDFSIAKTFGKQRVSLGLENILDTYYETEYGYPAPGLNFFLHLSASI